MSHTEAPWCFVEKYYSDDVTERNTPETKFYLSWLKHVKGKKVLSLGCGPNLYDDLQFFGEVPEEVIGIDLNSNNIEFMKNSKHPELLRVKKLAEQNSTKVTLITGDILKKRPEWNEQFDTVYAVGVLGMFEREKLQKLLKTIYSYLKPQGNSLDVDWTDCQLSKEKLKERESFDWYSKKGPSITEIGELMKQTGFKITHHEVYEVPNKEEYFWGKIYGYVANKK